MEVLLVNSNLYVDPSLKELMMEEISQIHSVICIYGTEAAFNEIADSNKGGTQLHLGFSPLPIEDVSHFISLYALYKGEGVEVNISNYDIEGSERINMSLYKYFIDLKDKNKNYLNYIQALDNVNKIITTTSIPTYKASLDSLNNDIELDKLLLTIFNYQYIHCEYKNINKGLSNSIKNPTILNNLYTVANNSFNKGARWRQLKDCLDLYVSYTQSSNKRALILYVSLFTSIANFYKNMLFSAHSYSYLLRSVEVLSCFYLFKNSYIFEERGSIYDSSGGKIVGAGPYLNLLKGLNKIDNTSILFHLLGIRNNSFQGHGLFSPNLDKYNSIYKEVTLLVNKLLSLDELKYYKECQTVFTLQSKEQLEKHLFDMFN